MKNCSFFLLFLFLSISLSAQIEVFTNGDVEVGSNLNVEGGVITDGLIYSHDKVHSGGDVYSTSKIGILHTGYPGPTVEINNNLDVIADLENMSGFSVGCLGSSTHQWASIYGEAIYLDLSPLTASDERIKENIAPLTNSKSRIREIQPVKYDLKRTGFEDNEYFKKYNRNNPSIRKERVGFLAQDLQRVYPEAVFYDSINDMYYIDYNAMIPLLLDGLKSQQDEIDYLSLELSDLKSESLKKSFSTEATGTYETSSEPLLFQNSPNPFNRESSIRYRLPASVSNAILSIYDLRGKLLRSYKLDPSMGGESAIIITAGEFQPGMYLYSLIVDNRLIDTKEMVITE